MRCFKQNERTRCKKYDPARTRTWNLLIRSQTPYPLGHEADIVYKEFYCNLMTNCITNIHCNTVILCLHLNEERDSRDFYSFLFPFFCTLQILSLYKVLDWCFPWINFFLDSINVVNCTAFNLRGFKLSVVISASPLKQYPTRVNIIWEETSLLILKTRSAITGPVAQRIRHLTTNQGIPGSNPGGVVFSLNVLLLVVPIYFFQIHYILVPQTVCDLTHYALQFHYLTIGNTVKQSIT